MKVLLEFHLQQLKRDLHKHSKPTNFLANVLSLADTVQNTLNPWNLCLPLLVKPFPVDEIAENMIYHAIVKAEVKVLD